MTDILKSKTIHALLWSFLESIGLRAVQFIIGILLARILFPEQFGLIAMLTIFMAVAQSFLDSGFGAALIQKHDITLTDTCSIFYFNIFVGVIAAGMLCLVAPWIAAFYDQPILTPLTRAMSLIIVINSFGLIQTSILTKKIDFKTQTKVSLVANAISGIIGIILALNDFGVWSLVVQQICASLFRTVSLWFLSPWRPAMIFSFDALREMFGFGSRLLLSDLLNRIFDNIYYLVIGKLFSAADLGFFTRARTLEELPSQTLAQLVGRVTFPVFSTIQDDPARLKRGLKKALTLLVLINFPMMIGLAVIARPLILTFYTEKWAESIPYLQLLCIAGLMLPVHVINLYLLMALKRSDLFLRLEIMKKALILINIVISWRWGISAMIYGMISVSLISNYVNSYYSGVLIKYPFREQLYDMLPYLVPAVLMGITVHTAQLLPFPNHWSLLLAQTIIGIAVYICLCRLFRLSAFLELWQTSWNKLLSLRARSAVGS